MFYTMTRYRRNRNHTEAYRNKEKLAEYIVRNSMEANGNVWNTLEVTVSYKARARLTPTLTHVVTYELVTSGAEDRAMSTREVQLEHLNTDSLLGQGRGMVASGTHSRWKRLRTGRSRL